MSTTPPKSPAAAPKAPWWARLAVALIPGCRTAETISYTHAPTEHLLQTGNLADPALAPFAAGGVTVAPFVVPLDYTNTGIKLAVLAKQPVTITLKDASLAGVGGSRALASDLAVAVDAPSAQPGLFQRDVTLGQLATADLDALGANGLVLSLVVVAPDGAASTLTYALDRHVQTYLVTR